MSPDTHTAGIRFRHGLLVGLLAVVCALVAANSARAADPQTLWATTAGSQGAAESSDARAVAALPDGSRIVVGSFTNTITFGSITLTSGDATSRMFVAKFDANNNAVWATRTEGAGLSHANAVAVLPDGSAIITGWFRNMATFGSTNLTAVGASDVFITKVNPNGTFVWATGAGGTAEDEGLGVAAFADGSSVVSGTFKTAITFGATTLTASNGVENGFAVRLDANGAPTWATQMSAPGATDRVYARGVAPLSGGATLVAGEFSGTTTFGTLPPLTAEGTSDAFVARLSAAGAVEWVARAGGSGSDSANAISTLADGSAIVTGSFAGTAAFPGTTALTSTGTLNGFVAKIKADGAFAWATRIAAGNASGNSVATRADGSSVISGQYDGAATFGSTTLPAGAFYSGFIARVTADGTFSWATGLVSTDVYAYGTGASYLPDGSVVAVGFLRGTATFGPTTLTTPATTEHLWTIGLLTTPQAPTGIRVTRGTREVTVAWTAPAGSRISGYRVSASPGKRTCEATGAETSCVVKRITGGRVYRFTVRALNAAGASPASAQSKAIRPAPNASVRIESISGRRGRIIARVRVNAPGPVVLRGRDGSRTVCLARRRATGPSTFRMVCRANAATRRQLFGGPLRIQATVTFSPPAALKATTTRSILLYRG